MTPILALDALHARLDALCGAVEAEALAVRRHLHRHPELGWHEHETQRFLADWLTAGGLSPTPIAGTGLVAEVGPPGAAAVVYRADLDALPLQDQKRPGVDPVVSEVPGVCHACGHDLHTAIGAGLARVFAALAPELPGPVRFLFQPAEEVFPCGGAAVVAAGATRGARAALALHADPSRDTGTVGVRVGPVTATSDKIVVDVRGHGGHGARPHLARDAIAAAGAVISALYALPARAVDPLEPAVLTLGTVHGGDADNIVADHVRLTGTLRTFRAETRERLHAEILRTAAAAAAIGGATAEVAFVLGSPSVVNDPRLHEAVVAAAAAVLGPAAVLPLPHPSTGSEDFGELSAALPTYLLRLGVRAPGGPTLHLHTPTFDVDERALGLALRVMGRALLAAFDAVPG